MIAKELKRIITNIPDDEDALIEIRDSYGNKYNLEIESVNATRQINIKDAVFAIKGYCFSRSGLMYPCGNCPFNEHGMCAISDLKDIDIGDLPNEKISIRREE